MLRPKFLLMENVKALVSQKFMPFFEKWQREVESYGYKNYWQVVNAKDCGVPQNRERVFMVSVLNRRFNFRFPRPIPLDRCLGDVLEDVVDESYYLRDDRIRGLMASTDAEKLAGRGFAFVPKLPDEIANAITSNAGSRKTDNFVCEEG